MFRISGLLSIVLAVVCGTLLFWTSQSVQKAENNLSHEMIGLSQEKESLRVLTAEWDYLNRPQRLEKLAKENFDLDGPEIDGGAVIQKVNAIPVPMVPVVPKMKPEGLLQHVSVTPSEKPAAPLSKTIQKTDRQEFDKLLDGFSDGEGEQ